MIKFITESTVIYALILEITGYPAVDKIVSGYKCPKKDIKYGCRGPKDCLYPNPKNCGRFIQCTAGGLAYDRPCAYNYPSLEWNDEKKICDWPSSSTCRTLTTTWRTRRTTPYTTSTTTLCPTTTTTYFSTPCPCPTTTTTSSTTPYPTTITTSTTTPYPTPRIEPQFA